MDYDAITIEPDGRGGWGVYGHGVYPESSVLAGQDRRSFLDGFGTLEEATAEWPHAQVLGHSTKVRYGETLEELSGLPETPPAWFDPAAAGETW